MQACRRFLISGRVQGVFFRASTAREASRRQLVGWARNLPDGRVEVLAGGDAGELDALAEWLREGPPRAEVTAVDASEASPDLLDGMKDFRTG